MKIIIIFLYKKLRLFNYNLFYGDNLFISIKNNKNRIKWINEKNVNLITLTWMIESQYNKYLVCVSGHYVWGNNK